MKGEHNAYVFRTRNRYSRIHTIAATDEATARMLAHADLAAYAGKHDLRMHIHLGGWEGNALSVAYDDGEDMLFGMQACVVRTWKESY